MTIVHKICDRIALHIDPLTHHLLDVIFVTVIDHVHIQETITISQNTHPPLDHFHKQEILDFLDLAHTQIQKTKNIFTGPNVHEVFMYLQKEIANAVTPTCWFYSLYTLTTSNQSQRDYLSRLRAISSIY